MPDSHQINQIGYPGHKVYCVRSSRAAVLDRGSVQNGIRPFRYAEFAFYIFIRDHSYYFFDKLSGI